MPRLQTRSDLPIRRIIRGTNFDRRPFNLRKYPLSHPIETLLERPTWSVRSLLPPSKNDPNIDVDTKRALQQAEKEITPEKLRHLLRLSALPPPKSAEEEASMLKTLRDQIHFVKAIQLVDTTGIEPLINIRDETNAAIREQTITLEKMGQYLKMEEKVGRNGTVRRRDLVRTEEEDLRERKTWEVDVSNLSVGGEAEGGQGRRRGRFFFVRRAKAGETKKVEASVDQGIEEVVGPVEEVQKAAGS